MGLQIVQVLINDGSNKTITGVVSYDRANGGTLVIPSGSSFPVTPQSGEIFWNTGNDTLYRRNDANSSWVAVSGGGGGGGSGDPNPSYIVLSTTGSLTNERVLNVSGSSGLLLVDTGPNGSAALSVNTNLVAMTSGSVFIGPTYFSSTASFSAGMSGSLTQLADGRSYLVAGANVTIASSSNGQVIISSTATGGGSGGGDPGASYLVLSTTASLSSERVLTVSGSSGLLLTDTGPNGNASLSVDTNRVATTSGSVFTGPTYFSSTASFSMGMSGSHTQLADGRSFLVAGANVTITSSSNGQIVIASTAIGGGGGSGADPLASYLVVSTTGSLPNDRALSAGTGIVLTDGGAGGSFTVAGNPSVFATVSGSTFWGPVNFSTSASFAMGLSGSLTQLPGGQSYIAGGQFITVSSASNGQVVIGTTLTSGADREVAYVTIGNTASLPNERALAVGTGLVLNDGGANGSVTIGGNPSVFATVSGSTFWGPVNFTTSASFSAGLSGSLTQLPGGQSYLAAGPNVTITSQSNGQVVVSAASFAPTTSPYLTLASDVGLSGERVLTVSGSSGLLLSDAGPNGNASLTVDTNRIATTSGSVFTGPTYFSSTASFSMGMSGSLTQLSNGQSYLVAGANVAVASSSNGQVVISVPTAQFAPPGSTYLTLTNDSTLTGERVLSVSGSTGLRLTDTGANGSVTLAVDTNKVATTSGSVFIGPVTMTSSASFTMGLSGSITQLTSGQSYIAAGANVTVASSSNGQIVISSTTFAPTATPYLTLASDATLTGERVLTVSGSSGLLLSDAGANGNASLSVDTNKIATTSGSVFIGPTYFSSTASFSMGVSGSLTQLADGRSYLVAGANVTIASSSNGQVVISATTGGGGGAPTTTPYLTLATDTGLSNERVLSVSGSSGLMLSDAGANGNASLSVNTNIIATTSGSVFTGPTYFSSTASFSMGMSGSLTQLADGRSFIVAGPYITVTSQSNGQIVITGQAGGGGGGGGADVNATYALVVGTGSLPNSRTITGSNGITITDNGAGSTLVFSQTVPFTSASHAGIRQLIHLAESGPFETFGSPYCDIGPAPFPTASIWYTDSGKTKRIVDQTVTYNANKTLNTITWRVYAQDGTTVVATATDTPTYSGPFEISRSRVLS